MNESDARDLINVLKEIRDRMPMVNWNPWTYPVSPSIPYQPYVGPTCGSGGSQTINCKGGENLG